MVQKEVADRICSQPGNMSLLSVSVQYYGQPKIVTKVKKGSFWPRPKVDSAIIKISGIKRKKNADYFFKIVKAGFSNKRKQLWKNLSQVLGLDSTKAKEFVKEITGNEKARAQELSVEQWESLAGLILGAGAGEK